MQAILHIGTEKTGTTSLQSFLAANETRLRDERTAVLRCFGFPTHRYLATYAMDDIRFDESHAALGLNTIEQKQAWKQRIRASLRTEIAALPPSIHQVIFSCEHCHSRLISTGEVRELKTLLRPYFDEYRVVVYLRRQDEVAVSFYSTALKAGHTHRQILPGCGKIDWNYFDYEALLQRWSDVFGRQSVSPRRFAQPRDGGRALITDFLAACQLRCESLDQTLDIENRSLSHIGQEFLRVFNEYVPGDASGNPSPLRGPIAQYLESIDSGSPRLPCREDAKRFYALFSDSNARVAEEWFDGGPLFHDDFSRYPAQEPDFDGQFADAVKIAAALWLKTMEQGGIERRRQPVTEWFRSLYRRIRHRLSSLRSTDLRSTDWRSTD